MVSGTALCVGVWVCGCVDVAALTPIQPDNITIARMNRIMGLTGMRDEGVGSRKLGVGRRIRRTLHFLLHHSAFILRECGFYGVPQAVYEGDVNVIAKQPASAADVGSGVSHFAR